MKRIKTFILQNTIAVFFAMSFVSCVSLTSKSGYVKYPDKNTTYSVEVNEVSVSNDKVVDTAVAEQVYTILESMFGEYQQENSIPLTLNVEIIQRSFFYKIEQKNSIYVSYYLYDSDNLIMQKGFYIETAATIVSSREQYKISKMIAKEIQEFITKSEKMYKEKK